MAPPLLVLAPPWATRAPRKLRGALTGPLGPDYPDLWPGVDISAWRRQHLIQGCGSDDFVLPIGVGVGVNQDFGFSPCQGTEGRRATGPIIPGQRARDFSPGWRPRRRRGWNPGYGDARNSQGAPPVRPEGFSSIGIVRRISVYV